MVKKISWNDYLAVNKYLLQLLLDNPYKYYKQLESYRKTFGIQFIKKVININTYEIYCGNHLHALVMITGNLVYSTSDEKKTIWGINKSLSDSVALKICKRLLEYGVDYNYLNYYNENPYQSCIDNSAYTSRYNNKLLKRKLRDKMIKDLNQKFEFMV